MTTKVTIPVGQHNMTADQAYAHFASIAAYGAAFVHWLPNIAVIVPTLYYLVVLYETETVQRHIRAWRERKWRKKLLTKHHD